MKCFGSSRGLHWARVASFWLVFCFTLVQVPLMAQSTTQGPVSQDGKPLSAMDLDEALKTARNEVFNSLLTFEQARNEAEIWRLDSLKWQTEALRLSFDLTRVTRDSEGLSKSLTESLKREADLKLASDRQDEIDAKAIKEARQERDEARATLPWVGVGGAILGALVMFLANLAF